MDGMNEWISVQDRLPKPYDQVMFAWWPIVQKSPRYDPQIGCWNGTIWISSRMIYPDMVSHWQELPPPPIGHQ